MDEERLQRLRHEALAAQAELIFESVREEDCAGPANLLAESEADAEAFFRERVTNATLARFQRALEKLLEHPESMLVPHQREALDRLAETVVAALRRNRATR